jgi:hypothetical protein
MAWPPTKSTGFTLNGAPTTIVWGTDGTYGSTIVKSIRSSIMMEEIKIENGTGLTVVQILLNDGYEVEITCVDDSAITFPAPGAAITIGNGSSGGDLAMTVVNNNCSSSRKQEGERVISAKKYTLI